MRVDGLAMGETGTNWSSSLYKSFEKHAYSFLIDVR